MSNLDAVRTERRLAKERNEPTEPRLGVFAAVALLIIAMVTGLAEIHYLPSFSADDVGCILFEAG